MKTTAERRPWEQLASEAKLLGWQIAAVRAFHKLVGGQEMTASEFKSKVDRVLSERYGY